MREALPFAHAFSCGWLRSPYKKNGELVRRLHLNGQTGQGTVWAKWYAKFRTGKCCPGIAFTILDR